MRLIELLRNSLISEENLFNSSLLRFYTFYVKNMLYPSFLQVIINSYYDFPMKWEGIMFSCSSSNFSFWVTFFTDLDKLRWVHYESGCLSVCPPVCRQIKRTSTQKVTGQFSRFIHIWIKQALIKKVIKRKSWIFEEKNIGEIAKLIK